MTDPLIGRGATVEAIVEHVRERRSVLVVGEAGSGRTMVLRAVAEQLGGARIGGALPSLRWHPYLPLSRAVGTSLGGTPAAVAAEVDDHLGGRPLVLDDLQWA